MRSDFSSNCLVSSLFCFFLLRNQNAPRPSEHPPVRGEKMSKRLGGIVSLNMSLLQSSTHQCSAVSSLCMESTLCVFPSTLFFYLYGHTGWILTPAHVRIQLLLQLIEVRTFYAGVKQNYCLKKKTLNGI